MSVPDDTPDLRTLAREKPGVVLEVADEIGGTSGRVLRSVVADESPDHAGLAD